MKKTISYRILHWVMLLLFLSGIAGIPAQGREIKQPEENVGVCPNTDGKLNYVWHNKKYTEPGTYTYKETRGGNEIIYTLNLYGGQLRTTTANIREGSRVVIWGKSYTTPGTYVDTIPSSVEDGCDTIVLLTVQYGEYFHQYDTIHMCEDDQWPVWHGIKTDKPGTYYDPRPASNRDSVYQLTLIKHSSAEYWDTIYVCSPQYVYYLPDGRRIGVGEDGDYDIDIKSPYGCDSLIHAHIEFVKSPDPIVNEVYFCGNLSIIRQDTSLVINKAMSLYDTIPTKYGCDSIIETRYIPYPTYLFEETHQIYEGIDVVTWRGKTYNEVGVYHDSLINQYGCDSVYRLYVIPKTDTYLTVRACTGEKIELKKDFYIEKDTLIIDTLKNAYGGDSIIHTSYVFWSDFHQSENITICSNQYVRWKNHIREGETEEIILHEAGEYRDQHRSVNGCDSSYTITVTVLKAYNDTVVLVQCNDSLGLHPIKYRLHGEDREWSEFNSDTVISDTMRHTVSEYLTYEDGSSTVIFSSGGCDSIKNYRIVTGDFCSPRERIPMCGNNPVVVDEKRYTTPGDYYNRIYTYRNLGVPDSVHNFEIFRVDPTEETDNLTLHELELPYNYRGTSIKNEGNHTIRLKNKYGCDSIIHLNVTVLPTIFRDINHLLCPNKGSYYSLPDGRRISEAGTYMDTIYGEHKNDTIVRVTLDWSEAALFINEPRFFLDGTTFTWRDHKDKETGEDRVFTEKGVYWDTCINRFGCDSIIYRLELNKAESFYKKEPDVTLCSSELPWEWHGKQVTGPGSYFDSCMTIFGLDSVWEIEVKVNPSYKDSRQITLCPGEIYTLSDGTPIDGTATTFENKFRTKDGCDSIITYYINRPEAAMQTIPKWFEHGTVYTWITPLNHTFTCEHGGHYYDTLPSNSGCDSIIYHLDLTEEYSYFIPIDSTVCLSEGEHYVSWHGKQCFTSKTYYDSLTTRVGLDSVIALNLTINRDTIVQVHAGLCQDSTYDFFGHILTGTGTYRSQPFPRYGTGCDSIIELILQPANTLITEVRYKLCEGDTIEIGHSKISTSGVYLDTLTSAHGCDSLVRYIVSVGKKYFFSDPDVVINPGNSYTWTGHHNDTVLRTPGTYWDSCKTAFGCDSIYKLTLRFNKVVYEKNESAKVCSADLPFVWHHQSLTASGLYHDSLKTDKGLDSIFHLYLTVNQTVHERKVLDFCEGDRHEIKGIPYERDTMFTDTFVTHWGCDSIVEYVLHFHPTYSISLIKNLKAGESFVLGDTTIKTAGVYFRRFETKYHCDSTVQVWVNMCDAPQEKKIYHNLCEGEQLRIGGKTVTTSGTYQEHLTAADGCDSLVTHIVNVHTAPLYTEVVSICVGDAYKWNGHLHDTIVDKPGVYEEVHKTKHECDSIYRLIVNYKHTDVHDTIISICASNLPYKNYKGEWYFKDSVFADTLGLNQDGCDSIIRWNYRINHHCSDYAQYNRCPDQIVTIDGLLISAAGAYEQHHLTQTGEDSLYRFIVHDVKKYEFTTRQRGCDSVVFNGKTYYARGKGQETFTVDLHHHTVEGCDSLEHLELTIYQSSPAHVFSKTIADYDSVRFGPYWHNTTGTYSVRHENANGCDSTEILNLTVLTTEYQETKHFYMCEGDPKGVEIFGRLHHPTQEYTYISDTVWISGMPVIRTADIILQHPFTVVQFYPDEDQIVCSDHEVLFYVNYTTKDVSILPDYYEVDFMVGNLEAHPLHQEGDINGKTTLPITMGGQGKYVSPGYYRYRLKLRSESCIVSDTILEGSIVVRYPENVMEAAWNDVVMLVNEQYNGGSWVFVPPYKWTVLSEQGVDKTALVAGDASLPYLYSSALAEGDRISALLYREGYDRPIPTCDFIFVPQNPVLPHGILVYPSAVRSRMAVTISSDKAGSFRLMDQTGRTCTTGSFSSGETSVLMPGTPGCYIMIMEDESGEHSTQKMFVY